MEAGVLCDDFGGVGQQASRLHQPLAGYQEPFERGPVILQETNRLPLIEFSNCLKLLLPFSALFPPSPT